mmetsp:Transcript_10633/g.26028  ORF Transcript_10633/g.26028 Transcript_10633/m.26028 type:complete len:365 (-) Transcript_10633:1476-2570(-)
MLKPFNAFRCSLIIGCWFRDIRLETALSIRFPVEAIVERRKSNSFSIVAFSFSSSFIRPSTNSVLVSLSKRSISFCRVRVVSFSSSRRANVSFSRISGFDISYNPSCSIRSLFSSTSCFVKESRSSSSSRTFLSRSTSLANMPFSFFSISMKAKFIGRCWESSSTVFLRFLDPRRSSASSKDSTSFRLLSSSTLSRRSAKSISSVDFPGLRDWITAGKFSIPSFDSTGLETSVDSILRSCSKSFPAFSRWLRSEGSAHVADSSLFKILSDLRFSIVNFSTTERHFFSLSRKFISSACNSSTVFDPSPRASAGLSNSESGSAIDLSSLATMSIFLPLPDKSLFLASAFNSLTLRTSRLLFCIVSS